jgi:hypothetical protein
MADLKISQLTTATAPLAGTEVLPLVQSSSTKKAAVNTLLSYASPVDNTVVRFNGTTGAVQNTNVVIDDNNNVGLAVTPSAWNSSEYRALQLGAGGWIAGRTQAGDEDKVLIGANLYNDGSWKYIASDQGSFYGQFGGVHYWYTAPTGVAGAAATVTQRLELGATGDLTLNTGNLIQGTAAKGINFTANTPAAGMTSQLLNWYEEGTWTPVLSDGTNNATMSANSQGVYTRIGRQVTVIGQVETTSLGSVTGNIRITGLPFSAGTGAAFYSSNAVGYAELMNLTAGQTIGVAINQTQNYVTLNLWDSTGGTTKMQATEWSSDGVMQFQLTYFA